MSELTFSFSDILANTEGEAKSGKLSNRDRSVQVFVADRDDEVFTGVRNIVSKFRTRALLTSAAILKFPMLEYTS